MERAECLDHPILRGANEISGDRKGRGALPALGRADQNAAGACTANGTLTSCAPPVPAEDSHPGAAKLVISRGKGGTRTAPNQRTHPTATAAPPAAVSRQPDTRALSTHAPQRLHARQGRQALNRSPWHGRTKRVLEDTHICRVHCGAPVQQSPDHLRVAVRRGIVQGGLALRRNVRAA
jgi:hypothetical protein